MKKDHKPAPFEGPSPKGWLKKVLGDIGKQVGKIKTGTSKFITKLKWSK